jgi:hypothetical protein
VAQSQACLHNTPIVADEPIQLSQIIFRHKCSHTVQCEHRVGKCSNKMASGAAAFGRGIGLSFARIALVMFCNVFIEGHIGRWPSGNNLIDYSANPYFMKSMSLRISSSAVTCIPACRYGACHRGLAVINSIMRLAISTPWSSCRK